MKKTVRYKDRDIRMKCAEMSHSSVGGEYEIGFTGKLEFNLERVLRNLKDSGYELEKMTDHSLSLIYKKSVITILKKGRILIQDLLPDTFIEAVKIGEEVIHAEQKN